MEVGPVSWNEMGRPPTWYGKGGICGATTGGTGRSYRWSKWGQVEMVSWCQCGGSDQGDSGRFRHQVMVGHEGWKMVEDRGGGLLDGARRNVQPDGYSILSPQAGQKSCVFRSAVQDWQTKRWRGRRSPGQGPFRRRDDHILLDKCTDSLDGDYLVTGRICTS